MWDRADEREKNKEMRLASLCNGSRYVAFCSRAARCHQWADWRQLVLDNDSRGNFPTNDLNERRRGFEGFSCRRFVVIHTNQDRMEFFLVLFLVGRIVHHDCTRPSLRQVRNPW